MTALARECAVIANFAGTPFIDKALPVVQACAESGTNYVDITGEIPLHRASYDAHHAQAKASGALIVHSCGYDSVPSDLGAWLAVRKLKEACNVRCAELKTFAGESRGGVSGGTLATALGMLSGKTKRLPGVAEAAARGSYPLDPEGAAGGPDSGDFGRVRFDARVSTWHMPNIMAGVNAPVVRKSAALLGYSTQPGQCSYSEVTAVGSMAKACLGTLGMLVGGLCMMTPPVRALPSDAKVLPPTLTRTLTPTRCGGCSSKPKCCRCQARGRRRGRATRGTSTRGCSVWARRRTARQRRRRLPW